MKKRLVVLLLTLAMTASVMTGCGATEVATSEPDNSIMTSADVESEPCEAEYAASSESATSQNSARRSTEKYDAVAETEAVDEGYAAYDYDDNSDMFEGETYKEIEANGFKSAKDNPLSTFAADVDTASYSNMRRMIDYGYGIEDFEGTGIRVEELINYFSYDYNEPEKGEVFGVDATIADCPWNEENKLLVLGIDTETMKKREKPDSNIVLLIDVSGSMDSYNKLPLLKEAMKMMVDEFSENDRISIVTYASGTEVVLDGVSGKNKSLINRKINRLSAGGATFGEGGIELAYKVAEEHFIEGGNNRIFIASDGDFNVGASTESELFDLISEKRDTGIFLSVLGVGMGNYDDVTMETLADNGNGIYAYIDSLSEAKKVLVDDIDANLYTVAKDTKFQIEFNPALVSEYRQIGYENRALAAEDFTDDTKDGGELGSGHQVTVMYEIVLADNGKGKEGLKYQEQSLSEKGQQADEWCTLSIAYKEPEGEKSKYLEYPIGIDNYTTKPSDDYVFAAAVAQVGMALNNSEYLVDFRDNYDAVAAARTTVYHMNDRDELQDEFLDMMDAVLESSSDYYGKYVE